MGSLNSCSGSEFLTVANYYSATHRARGPAGVSAAVDDTALQILAYDADASSLPGEVGKTFDIVSARREGTRRAFINSALYCELTGVGFVRGEGVWLAVGHEAWRFSRLLRRHAKQLHIEQHLNVRLVLIVAARRSERHDSFAGADSECWVWR